jgi:adenine-specific DNA-methyltransferase
MRPKARKKKNRVIEQSKTNGLTISLRTQDAFEMLESLAPNSVDLFVSSPPYHVGKEYDVSSEITDFEINHELLIPLLVRALKEGGSICWQVGHHVRQGTIIPLDAVVYPIFSRSGELQLRNRIVWTFGHGVHANRRFSGRHETILWFTKGDKYTFNLDSVRVPQKYPGKRHYKGPRKGLFSGNPLGKNPGDVWDIPNVKSKHIEKTQHPCQFPVALVQRLVKALVPRKGLVVDPFMGSGSSAIAASIEGRRFIGSDVEPRYVAIARKRITQLKNGKTIYRPLSKPIYIPSPNDAVAVRPSHFRA